jgi:type II secretory pathway pseudopilin PulG
MKPTLTSPVFGNATTDRQTLVGGRDAFTLIELLLVVGVVVILIGILLPILSQARNVAKDTACLANHRQFGIAFGAYVADFRQFPIADAESPQRNRTSWAGVDWYLEDADTPGYLLDNRPMNPYLGVRAQHEGGFGIFRCPRDNSMRYTGTDERIDWEEDFGFQSYAEDQNESVYVILGTSYAANEWMWVHPQSEVGFGFYPWPYYKRDMEPDDVLVNASQFVLVTGYGVDRAGRLNSDQRMANRVAYGWWHGYETGQMTFLDGSARQHQMGGIMTRDYCYWSNPDVQWRYGHRP